MLNVSSRIFLQVILPALILKRNFLWWGPGVDPENSERGGRDTCQLYKFFLFFWEFYKNNKKKKKGWSRPPRPTPKSALEASIDETAQSLQLETISFTLKS